MKKIVPFMLAGAVLALMNCAGPAGPEGPAGSSNIVVYYGGDDQDIPLYTTPSLSRTISISVPGPGTIVFEASGYFYSASLYPYIAEASLSLASTTMNTTDICVVKADSSINYNPYYVSTAYRESAAGTYTVYLLGDITLGSGGYIDMRKNSAIATFYPD